MRYVAKIHVLDVMDQVVVSGYVYDAEGPVRDGEAPLEFTWATPGRGFDEPLTWLMNSFYEAFMNEQRRISRRGDAAPLTGGAHTISESGDTH